MNNNADSARCLAISQLARTRLGLIASQKAKELSGRNPSESIFTAWWMHGVVCQQCEDCAAVCYPPRPLCPVCLADRLVWSRNTGGGRVLSTTSLHVSLNDLYQRADLDVEPWVIGMVAHDDGPLLYVFLDDSTRAIGSRVELFTVPDLAGNSVIVAVGDSHNQLEKALSIAAKLVHVGETGSERDDEFR